MCCYLKSGNCIVRNQEILKNKLNSLTARAENNNLPGTATAVSSLDLEAQYKIWKQCVTELNQVITQYETGGTIIQGQFVTYSRSSNGDCTS